MPLTLKLEWKLPRQVQNPMGPSRVVLGRVPIFLQHSLSSPWDVRNHLSIFKHFHFLYFIFYFNLFFL